MLTRERPPARVANWIRSVHSAGDHQPKLVIIRSVLMLERCAW